MFRVRVAKVGVTVAFVLSVFGSAGVAARPPTNHPLIPKTSRQNPSSVNTAWDVFGMEEEKIPWTRDSRIFESAWRRKEMGEP